MESFHKSVPKKSKGNCTEEIMAWASEYYHLNLVIFLSWMLSLTMVIVLFVLWMRSSVANEEKERRMAYEARKVSQSQMSTLTQPHTAVSIPQAKSMTDYHSRVSIETNSRTSSGLSPQSLPLLSASASPNPSQRRHLKQNETSFKYEMSEMKNRQDSKAEIHM